jgi:hypothetical protein
LKQAGIFKLARELCPLTLLLSNPSGNFKEYAEDFQLNAAEVEKYAGLYQPGSLLAKSADRSTVAHLWLDDEALWTYKNDALSNARRNEARRKYGNLPDTLAALARGEA